MYFPFSLVRALILLLYIILFVLWCYCRKISEKKEKKTAREYRYISTYQY